MSKFYIGPCAITADPNKFPLSCKEDLSPVVYQNETFWIPNKPNSVRFLYKSGPFEEYSVDPVEFLQYASVSNIETFRDKYSEALSHLPHALIVFRILLWES